LPPANVLTGPVRVDISKILISGKHQIEFADHFAPHELRFQVLAAYYVPWTHASLESGLHQEAKGF